MKIISPLLAAPLVLCLAMPSIAQDAHAGHGAIAAMQDDGSLTPQLPEICLMGEAASGMAPIAMDHDMDAARADLMAGMEENNQLMMQAGMAEDLDVAFVCAMIPHHQSAINMARAELEHGDDVWAKDMARKIIETQESEIAEMMSWLEAEAAGE